jgi:hypothetical protein
MYFIAFHRISSHFIAFYRIQRISSMLHRLLAHPLISAFLRILVTAHFFKRAQVLNAFFKRAQV